MRNLKRALSLALASVMLLGMMVVGAGAESYPDVDGENNVEAIEVLKAVGAMIGDENGNFNPDKPVTRNEMAAVVARLLLGPDAEDYNGDVPFTDVPEWAVKYVAACYDNGIVTGRDETTYDGNGTVTAQEAAAMMLRALGYENITGTGADWAKPAVAEANKINLFKGIGTGNATAALNRNAVAQLSLNTLKATCVDSDVERDIVIEGVLTYPGKTTYTKHEAEEDTLDYREGELTNKYQELCEKLYDGKLTLKKASEPDDFGRPASAWNYDGTEIIKVTKDAKKTYVGAVASKTLWSDLGLRETYAVGSDTAVVTHAYEDGADYAAPDIVKNDKDTKIGKDGQVVEAYYTRGATASEDELYLVIVSSYLGVVTDDSAKDGDKTGIRVEVSGVGNKFFETDAEYAEGDVFLLTYNQDKGEIAEILGEPETVTGEITRVADNNMTVTIDGKKYPQAIQFDEKADDDVIKGKNITASSVTKTYTLYLDANGCYLAAVEVEDHTTTSLVYVFKAREAQALDGDEVKGRAMLTVIDTDGTTRNVKVELEGAETPASATAPAGRLGLLEGTFAYLTYDEDDDEYTIAAPASGDDYASATYAGATFELKAGDKNSKFGASEVYFLNNDTVYLFVSIKDDKPMSDTTREIDKIEVFTGGVDASVTSTDTAVAAESNGRVGYVVVTSGLTATADDVIYIQSRATKDTETVKNGTLYKKSFILGVDSTAAEHAVQTGANGVYQISSDAFYKYTSVKSNGNLDKLTKVTYVANDDGKGAVYGQQVTKLVDGSGTIATIVDTHGAVVALDFTKATIVDISSSDNNDYGTINSLTALTRAVNRGYNVTADVYVNGDSEVVALFVKTATAP